MWVWDGEMQGLCLQLIHCHNLSCGCRYIHTVLHLFWCYASIKKVLKAYLVWNQVLKKSDCGTQKQHHLLSAKVLHHCVVDHSIILEVEFSGVHLLYSDLLFTWTCLHFLMFAVSFAVYNAIDNSLNMLLQCFIHAVQLNSNARKHLISWMMLDV
jgi:hypothetical protein